MALQPDGSRTERTSTMSILLSARGPLLVTDLEMPGECRESGVSGHFSGVALDLTVWRLE